MDECGLKFHPEFFKDLKKLSREEKENVCRQIKKIKQRPNDFKRLRGFNDCYRVRMGNLRIVYYLDGHTIWMLTVERRKAVYGIYYKRLFKIKRRLD
jgi:mRNA-degrading endonuclease RelE of RelBE toxin-antitoxin system